jgi:hypothetical protein
MQDINRFFAFGCSFTNYKWGTWANILGADLDCEFYNLGKSGAGNTYISNMISQADSYFNFNSKDLIIVCWTNISREDRWIDNSWVTPGNIYSQPVYDHSFVENYANEIHFSLRDFSYMHFVKNLLEHKGANFYFLQMCDIKKTLNQWETKSKIDKKIKRITNLYEDTLSYMTPSFYDVLWNGDMKNKWKRDWKEIHPNYSDGHPTLFEHLRYLEKTIAPWISIKTKTAVRHLYNDWKEYVQHEYTKTSKPHGLHDFPNDWVDQMIKNYKFNPGEPIPHALFD